MGFGPPRRVAARSGFELQGLPAGPIRSPDHVRCGPLVCRYVSSPACATEHAAPGGSCITVILSMMARYGLAASMICVATIAHVARRVTGQAAFSWRANATG